MRFFYKLPLRLRSLFRKESVERELRDELRFHLENLIEEKVAKGMTPQEARSAALRELGGLEQIKEECRDLRRVRYIESFVQDVRYGLRQLRRNPGFTLVAILTLALGIGATTAIFSVVDAVLLRPPLFQDPYRLVAISEKSPQGDENDVSVGNFADFQEESSVFQGIAAYTSWEFHTLTGVREPDEVWSSAVSPNLFHVLGAHAVLGRAFVSGEAQSLVLSYKYWRNHFLSDRTLIGKALALDGKPYVVVGVMPANFEFPASDAQMWIPLTITPADRNGHKERQLSVVARLKAEVTLKQAQVEMETIAHRLAAERPETNKGWSVLVKPFQGPHPSKNLRAAILALFGAVIFVQLIVCANVAGTLFARGVARQGEIAIRAALGASRWRLVRQLLAESVMLAGAASVAGLGVAWAGLRLIVSLVPRYTMTEIHDVGQITINLPVLGFTVALALATGIATGLLPALRASGSSLDRALKERGRTPATGARGSRLQRVLVVFEVTLALVLLAGAGLMIQSFERLETAPTGFNPDHLLTVRVPLAKYKYREGGQSADFYREVLRRIQAIPGVKSAGMSNNLPLTGFSTRIDFPAPQGSPARSSDNFYVEARNVSPGYFEAMGIPVKAGRDFNEADSEQGARCVRIVNQTLARRYWPGRNPVGLEVPRACPKDAGALIVGVVGDSKQFFMGSEAEPEVYLPYAQHPFASFLVTFIIRTASDPLDVAAAVRRAVWGVDHDQPVIQVRSMENVIEESLWPQHFSASILGVFAAIALILSSLGIYGVLSYAVSRRTHEIGVRMALGAERRDVLRLVVGQGLRLTLIGVAIGIAGALGLTRFLASLLYGVKPTDAVTFLAVSLLLTAVALLASYVPARRAAKVDPVVALRCE